MEDLSSSIMTRKPRLLLVFWCNRADTSEMLGAILAMSPPTVKGTVVRTAGSGRDWAELKPLALNRRAAVS